MDFSTMEDKLDRRQYQTLVEFIYDFRLIHQNCHKYNKPGTVYYTAATNLKYRGDQILAEKNLREIIRDMRLSDLATEQLGFKLAESTQEKSGSKTSSDPEPPVVGSETFISAAEWVKFGRRGAKKEAEQTPTKPTGAMKPPTSRSGKKRRGRPVKAESVETGVPGTKRARSTQRGRGRKKAKVAPIEEEEEEEEGFLLRSEGCWVQCCQQKCGKWRYVEQFKTVAPEFWECSMNTVNFTYILYIL